MIGDSMTTMNRQLLNTTGFRIRWVVQTMRNRMVSNRNPNRILNRLMGNRPIPTRTIHGRV